MSHLMFTIQWWRNGLPEDGTVRLSRRKRAIRDATASTVRKVLDAAQANFDELIELWEEYHGSSDRR